MRALTIVVLLLCLVVTSAVHAEGGKKTAGIIIGAILGGLIVAGADSHQHGGGCGHYGYSGGYDYQNNDYAYGGYAGQSYAGYPDESYGYGSLGLPPDVPSVISYKWIKEGVEVLVNRPYQVGQRLLVLGPWLTDPNTGERLTRRRQALLTVEDTNGIVSTCYLLTQSGWPNYAERGMRVVVVN